MIWDTIANGHRYGRLLPGLAAGFEFFAQADLDRLASGRHEIDGKRVYALVDRREGSGKSGAKLEVHRRHLDIQVSLDGREQIGWRALADCHSVDMPYHDEQDAALYTDPPQVWLPLAAGQFMVFFPQDAHSPLCGEGMLGKVVIKVAIE